MMSELISFERSSDYSWDLQAIVKGQQSNISMEMPSSSYTSCSNWLQDYYNDYQNHHENAKHNEELLVNELDQLCMPNQHILSNISSPETPDNTMISTVDENFAVPAECCRRPIDELMHQTLADGSSYSENLAITLPKRRKNKNKKTLVQQATGDRVVSDKWNWRKYGEKVIKGSPYPRSYYRCSNSGGCVARKQVEQSCTQPGIYLITYIDEHSHSYPSRRPSQAGRTSRRFRASTKVLTSTDESVVLVDMSTTVSTPTAQPITKEGGGVYVPNYVLEDDFFAGLEYLEGVQLDFINM